MGFLLSPTNDMSVPASYAKGLFNIDVRQRSHLEDALQKVRPMSYTTLRLKVIQWFPIKNLNIPLSRM